MNEKRNDESTAQYLANVMIRLITDRPECLTDAANDADMMIGLGVANDVSRNELIAEAIIHMFVAMNAGHIEGLREARIMFEPEITRLLTAHLDNL